MDITTDEKSCLRSAKEFLDKAASEIGFTWYEPHSSEQTHAVGTFIGEITRDKYRDCIGALTPNIAPSGIKAPHER